MYDTILIPTDGSDSANRAIEHGLSLAREYDSTIHTMYVVDTSRYGEPALSSAEIVLDELEQRGQDLTDDVAERADNDGIETVGEVRHGRPDAEIVGYADAVDADVIVIGFQGHSHRRPNNVGSVTDRVIRSTDRPVFMV
ncbi:Nucleotide-binding universal stress protein, UspA family [Natronoarchaeum philippinense]|uniref:Nucleotide-binding universal stress protein, UspA family n=1 Tax=Natronoarchaeum philippinense TaxID=558529 RepID=A0A285N365_NATPI|nr:universal stress protein [Natronoarchaeum philippinense]SNZ03267.1 Nucleotide-binding universal stress protein, UspA family [Natronoarchaeum philippinense]